MNDSEFWIHTIYFVGVIIVVTMAQNKILAAIKKKDIEDVK